MRPVGIDLFQARLHQVGIPSEKVRLFPNGKNIRFVYPIHEVLGPSLTEKKISIRSFPHPVHHYGKLDQIKEKQKDEHYFAIGLEKLSDYSDDPVAVRELAIQASKLGKHEDSVNLWEKMIELEPGDDRNYVNLASNLGKLKRYHESREAAQKAVKLAPGKREGYLNLGLSELHLNNLDAAERIFRAVSEKNADYYSAVFLLGASELCQGKYRDGEITFKKLKNTVMWDSLSYAIQDLLEGIMDAGLSEPSLNLIAGSELLGCSNDKIREYNRQLQTKAA